MTVTGTVVDLQFMNRHSIVFFDVTDKTGKPSGNRPNWGPQNKHGSGDLNLSHESKITMTDAGKVIHNSIKADQAPPEAPAN